MLHPLILICFFFCDKQRGRQLSDTIKSSHCMPLSTDLIRHREITESSPSVYSHNSGLSPSGELCSLIVLEVSLWREPFRHTSVVFSIFWHEIRMHYGSLVPRGLLSACLLTLEMLNWTQGRKTWNLFVSFNKLSDLSELFHQDMYI